MLRIILLSTALVLPVVALAQEGEWSVKLYYQPDSSGSSTQNKSMDLEGNELEIEASGETRNRLVDVELSDSDAAALRELIAARIRDFEFTATDELDYPYIEIQFEFDGESRSIEVEERYKPGEMPEAYLDLQRAWFETIFE